MKKRFPLVLLLCVMAAGAAAAGQFRITPPKEYRKRQPPAGYRESRLEIVNEDDRGYAVDVDYRRNRLTLLQRSGGDIFVPGNSSVALVFDDDDDWTLIGDHESVNIEIRSGRTATVRLETRWNGRQAGLFATVRTNGGTRTRQVFRYSDRPGGAADRGGPGVQNRGHSPAPTPSRSPAPSPSRSPTPSPSPSRSPAPAPQSQRKPNDGPRSGNGGSSVGKTVGSLIDSLFDNDRPGSGGPRR